jgi:hypothetical protein
LRDAHTGAPIAQGRASAAEIEAVSDAQGLLALTLAPGEHTVRLSAAGYRAREVTIQVTREAAGPSPLSLERLVVRGALRDATTDDPLPSVILTLGQGTVESDANGQFALPADPTAPLRATLPGYAPAVVPSETWLTQAEAEEELALALSPRVLRGRLVEDGSEAPLVGVAVTVGTQSALTDADGAFEVTRIEPGDAISHASATHHPLSDTLYHGEAEITLAIVPWIAAVTVTDAETEMPLPGARAASPLDEQTADAQGALNLRAAPGQAVEVAHTGYATATLTYAGEAALAVALEPSRLTLSLKDGATGQPITRATVLVPAGDGLMPLPVDAAGALTLDDVRALGEITVKAPGYARVTVPITRAGALELALEPFDLRAIYVPFGLLTRPERLAELLDLVDSTELNGIVVDVKSDRAWLAWQSDHPLAIETEGYLPQVMPLEDLLAECRRRGIYVVARIVAFKDDLLAEIRPDWAVKREDGTLYVDQENLRWVDPFRQEVRDYNVHLALEMAALGFDEVQFDYIRFPSDGSTKGLVYQQESNFENRTAAMAAFCQQAGEAMAATPAFFSVDIFGLTVWVDPSRDMGIGQRVEDIAPYVDYLCPMLYPQTFGPGNLGFDNPVLHPYEVLYHSVKKTRLRTDTLVRPWLQHYSLFGYTYGVEELLRQKKGAEDAGSAGWTYWNAGGRYNADILQPDAYKLMKAVPTPAPTGTPTP